ncbi:pentatricopeptide repeat-containing protein At4g16470-like, partial [Phalaenopsis equestris]|uniref:pentatricopeptide repeat-containing protein At4g16470-like n=1 Tax=Phalaenopsis equestris TaxID=78828 RepID=UPI0009E63539
MHKTLRSLCLSGRLNEAVKTLFCSGSPISPPTYSLLLQESIHRREFLLGKAIHSHIIATGFTPTKYLNTKLLILYTKAGELKSAHHLFDEMPDPNLFAYNAMISGFAHEGLERGGLELYYSMRDNGVDPDPFTFSSVFHACAGLAALEHGRRAHCLMIKRKAVANVVVGSALVDMYFKCSSLDDARRVFDELPDRNVITWTSLISGYGLHGKVREVIQLFHQMEEEGFRPNSVTFLSLLSACSHGGLIDSGWKYFVSMIEDYRVAPKKEHYTVMVDMMGRAGKLYEAYEFIRTSPCESHSTVWGALVGACRNHGDVEMVKVAASRFFELMPENVGKYVVVSNAFAASEMWEKAADVWERIGRLGMRKGIAWSSVAS